jgi:phosphoribosylglycinamide formyltransferase-1
MSTIPEFRFTEERQTDPCSGALLVTTVPSAADAERLAKICVEERLSGCVAIIPSISSVYRWNDAVTMEQELQIQFKTTHDALPHLRRRIIELHPYEIPAIIEINANFGAAYGRWLAEEIAPAKTPSVVILASGRGSNARALVNNQGPYRISTIISDNENAPVLSFAAEAGIKGLTCSRKAARSIAACQEKIATALVDLAPNLIVLAGFMQILKPWFVEQFGDRLINIHPSLLPAYPGLNTHQRALSAGETLHGATVHLVDSGVDTGPVIAQAPVPVLPADTSETLAARVLDAEHRLFPWVITAVAKGELSWPDKKPRFTEAAISSAKEYGFLLPE